MRTLPALAALLCALASQPALAEEPLAAPARAALGALDFVFIALAGYVVWRIIVGISRRKPGDDGKTYDVTPENRDSDSDDPKDRRSRAAQAAWEYLTGVKGPDLHPEESAPKAAPGMFDEADFLRGAKIIFGRIRQSWAKRDLADLRQFTSPDMMRTFEQWASERPDREEITVLLVDAKVLDMKKEEKQTVVDVAYEATVSDDPKANASKKVSEVWRFVRDDTVMDGNWLLESMEKTQ